MCRFSKLDNDNDYCNTFRNQKHFDVDEMAMTVRKILFEQISQAKPSAGFSNHWIQIPNTNVNANFHWHVEDFEEIAEKKRRRWRRRQEQHQQQLHYHKVEPKMLL